MAEGSREDVTVVIADDHPVVRKGLRLLVDAEPGLRVVADAGTGVGARLAREPPRPTGPPDDLSDRELEVLKLIALGFTNSEIGTQLHLSVRTVESHRAHIQQKDAAIVAGRARPLRANPRADRPHRNVVPTAARTPAH